jgi:histidinol phosphatase-like PHP family hydrolase
LNKVIEIDCYPDRQDMSLDLRRLARKTGCRISLGTDSQAASQPEFIEFGMAAALKGKIDPERNEFHGSRGLGELGKQETFTPESENCLFNPQRRLIRQ